MMIRGRPLCAIINLHRLYKNFSNIKAQAGKKRVIAVVKDDAYGHGAVRVVKKIDAQSDYFGVACIKEAALLSRHTAKPFIVFGGVFAGEARHITDRIIPVIYDFDGLQNLKNLGIKCSIEIELDTGMGRTGFQPHEIERLMSSLKSAKNIRLHGIMTHFSSSDCDRRFTEKQSALFDSIVKLFYEKGFEPELIHIANSAGLFYNAGKHINAVRPGIMLYGGYPSEGLRNKIALEPVMDFRTKVIAVKRVKKGTPVSYGRTYITERESAIATLAAGYGDGYPRILSNRGVVYVENKGTARIAGRVCMDMIMSDVTDLPEVKKGDDVVLWGEGDAEVHPDKVAALAETISYELFCGVSGRAKKIYRDGA